MNARCQKPLRFIVKQANTHDYLKAQVGLILSPLQHMMHAKCPQLCPDLSRQISIRDREMFIILHCSVSSTSGRVPEQDVARVNNEQSSLGHLSLIPSSRSWPVCWMNGHCKQQVLMS